MLAGHDEGGGEIITKSYLSNELSEQTGEQYVETKEFVKFYGMSSTAANDKHFDSRSIEAVKEEKFLCLTEEQWAILFKISWGVCVLLVLTLAQ